MYSQQHGRQKEGEEQVVMRNRSGWKRWLLIALASFLAGGVLAACAERRPAVTEMDTPERHVTAGMHSFDQGDLDEAQGEFDQALGLDPQYGPAHVGKGLVLGAKAIRSRESKERTRIITDAFSSLKNGKKYAADNEQKMQAYVAYIRLHTMIQDRDWLADTEENFKYATAVDRRASAAWFFMGEAYREAYRFSDAAAMYRRVLDLGRDYTGDAGRAWALMQRIQQAAPGTAVGKRIALGNAITRAEAAALFVQELRLSEVYARRGSGGSDEAPGASKSAHQTESMAEPRKSGATDLATHPLGQDVEAVLGLGVDGLELYPDHTFHPNERVTRAEFALMVEGILIRATGYGELATQFTGKPSPFVDLRDDSPYFDAVMVCTSTGIMKAADLRGREFRPAESISGADALLAIRSITDYLARLKTG
jgi:tetratricopeptide (TPR) repeat protein